MQKYFSLAFFFIYCLVFAYETPDLYPSENLNDEQYFLNPLLNYEFSYLDKNRADELRYNGSFINISYGSLSTTEFLRNEEVVINSQINDHYIFNMRYKCYENRHRPYNEQKMIFGFGNDIITGIRLLFQSQVHFQKKELDAIVGILFFSEDNNYFSISLTSEEFMYNEKADIGVNTITEPFIFSSETRYNHKLFYFYSNINISTYMEREFAEGDLTYYSKMTNKIITRLEFKYYNRIKLYNELEYNRFAEKKNYRDTLNISYDVNDKFIKFDTGFDLTINDNSSIRAGLIYSFEEKSYLSTKPFEFEIETYSPYIFYRNRIYKNFEIEPAYIVQINTIDNLVISSENKNMLKLAYNDLIKLGIYFNLSENSSLYLSTSHLINYEKYGGGNLRFNYYF